MLCVYAILMPKCFILQPKCLMCYWGSLTVWMFEIHISFLRQVLSMSSYFMWQICPWSDTACCNVELCLTMSRVLYRNIIRISCVLPFCLFKHWSIFFFHAFHFWWFDNFRAVLQVFRDVLKTYNWIRCRYITKHSPNRLNSVLRRMRRVPFFRPLVDIYSWVREFDFLPCIIVC